MAKLPTEQYLNEHPTSLGELANSLYPGVTYDTALPQPWVDRMYQRHGVETWRRYVWGYPKGSLFGQPLPLTVEAQADLERTNHEE